MNTNAEKTSIRNYRDKIIAMFAAGKSSDEIAKTIGYSKNYLVTYCKREGILTKRPCNFIKKQEGHDIMELHDHGIPKATIARLLHRSTHSVTGFINRAMAKRAPVEKDGAPQPFAKIDDAIGAEMAREAADMPITEIPAAIERPAEVLESNPIQPVLSVERVETVDERQTPQVFEIPIVLRVSTVYNKPEVNSVA